ncbi:hypothetical protein [Microbacterium invictum]|uniref:Signal transduction histidine kinase n=1 Tax=Microbacterium invictum TaxID=515415 RepID=A0AA40SN23_9MICO|nr:hypothetical protein [Microbacterium invictum]MBB4139137.1 signal transduction histidine kinase [Microbacterium invictum]
MSEPLPRTAAEPMAFTQTEFLRGALSAWLWFLLLDISVYGIIFFPMGAAVAAMFAVPWSAAAVAVFAFPAWLLGRALRRRARVAVHVAAFAALGVVVGVITTATYLVVATGRLEIDSFFGSPLWVVNVAASAFAMVLGWRRGARAVLRPRAPSIRRDADAAAEDALVDPACGERGRSAH